MAAACAGAVILLRRDARILPRRAQILRHKDADGTPLLEKIRDAAGQKGTGKWTAIEALEQGMPVTLIGEAVFARCLSALQDQRIAASARLAGPSGKFAGDRASFLDAIRQALFASKVVSYAQGFMLMAEAAKQYGWNLNYGEVRAPYARPHRRRARPRPSHRAPPPFGRSR